MLSSPTDQLHSHHSLRLWLYDVMSLHLANNATAVTDSSIHVCRERLGLMLSKLVRMQYEAGELEVLGGYRHNRRPFGSDMSHPLKCQDCTLTPAESQSNSTRPE
jgi:hypothetical protein